MYQYGNTPLICAAFNGHLAVVEYLLENGANLEAKNTVSDVIISSEITRMSQMNMYLLAVPEWKHTIHVYCRAWSFIGG